MKLHGTPYRYKRGCRCEECKAANTKACRVAHGKLAGQEPPEHGTAYAYSIYECRCAQCTRANAEYIQQYRERRSA